jgi:hypothetical protein
MSGQINAPILGQGATPVHTKQYAPRGVNRILDTQSTICLRTIRDYVACFATSARRNFLHVSYLTLNNGLQLNFLCKIFTERCDCYFGQYRHNLE